MADEEFMRRLTAILSADVAGYSRLMSEDESATVRTLGTYRKIMASLIKQHRGRVVDSPGDNVLTEFGSVVDAVQCGVSVQKEFQARNAGLPENRRMEFRVGINLGDVIEEEGRSYGDGVNIAARLEALAEPGGICISKTAFDQIETKLPLGYEFLGEQTVKNIAKPVGAYRVVMEPRVTVLEEKAEAEAIPFWRRKAAIAGAIAVLVVIIGVAVWNFYFRLPPIEPASTEKMAYPLPDKPSIAVLPFVNMSGDSEQEYIADGITENIIAALSKIREMFVIARTSAMTYKGQAVKVKQVSEELGVRYVLEGSVQKEGDRVRITAQLVDAVKGHHLWAERYDRDMKGFFDLLDEITKEIGAALQVELTWGSQARYIEATDNFEAWGYCTKAYSHFFRFNKEDNARACELAEKALKLDPDYVTALTLVGWTHVCDAGYRWSESPAESIQRAEESAQKALAIDEFDAGAHALLGNIYEIKGQIEKAIAEGKRAIALDPNSAGGYLVLAKAMLWSGRFEEAISSIETAMRLQGPHFSTLMLFVHGYSLSMVGHHEEALAAFRKLLERSLKGQYPEFIAHMYLAGANMRMGRVEDAQKHADEVLRLNPKFSLEYVRKISHFTDPVLLERRLEPLRKAGLPEKPPVPLPDKPSIAVLPFTNMSGDPEQEYFTLIEPKIRQLF